jgi:hypothetical protein
MTVRESYDYFHRKKNFSVAQKYVAQLSVIKIIVPAKSLHTRQ